MSEKTNRTRHAWVSESRIVGAQMPTTMIIDLDEVFGADKKVRLAGTTYVLPPDAPIEMVMRHQAVVDANTLDGPAAERMYQDALGLFRHKQPKLESVPLMRGQLLFLLRYVYILNAAGGEDLVDLDILVDQDPKRVRLAGRTYDLPPDIPVDLWLRINNFDAGSDTEVIANIYGSVLELFRYANPDLKELQIGTGTLVRAMNQIYNQPANVETPASDTAAPDGDPAVPPTRRARSRTGSPSRGSPRPPKRKRGTSSSQT